MIWVILGAQAVFLAMYSDMLGNEHTIPFWAHYFILGILVQRFWDRLAVPARSLRGAASSVTCSICVIVALVALLPGSRSAFGLDEFPIYADPYVMLFVTLLFAFSRLGGGIFSLLSTPAMVWLGNRSFGIYLFHLPVFVILDLALEVQGRESPVYLFTAMLLTVAVAHALHLLIERPGGRWIRARLSAERNGRHWAP